MIFDFASYPGHFLPSPCLGKYITRDVCGISEVFDCAKIGTTPRNPQWANSIKCIINNLFNAEWEEDIKSKSSLIDYCRIKSSPGLELYLLDDIDFLGASIKFKLRSNTLPLEMKVSK